MDDIDGEPEPASGDPPPTGVGVLALALRPGEPEAIFVVGVSRSGTTLMRRVLDRHSRIAIAPENHFLGHLLPWEGARRKLRGVGDLHDDDAVRRLVAMLYSDAFQAGSRLREASPFWRWLRAKVPQAQLEARLLAGERSERGVFTGLLHAYADRRGRAIIGEKTPAHIAFADTLLEWYPGARIVHMVRDPRAVFVSELRRRREHAVTIPYRWLVRVPQLFGAFILLEVAWAWAGAVADHRRLARTRGSAYHAFRFEDLVRQPDATVDELCAFLGVAPEPTMLRQRVVSAGSMLGQTGFDAEAADRWLVTITRGEGRWLDRLLGRRIAEMGYASFRELSAGVRRGADAHEGQVPPGA